MLTFTGAILVFLFGVIVTSGVYGSRMAWLLGVVLPLLAVTAVQSKLALSRRVRVEPFEPKGAPDTRKTLFRAPLVLLAIPAVLALMLLSGYGLIFVLHGIGLLH